jgi:hypothetical protein
MQARAHKDDGCTDVDSPNIEDDIVAETAILPPSPGFWVFPLRKGLVLPSYKKQPSVWK